METQAPEKMESLERYNRLYLEIINRYKDYIEERENLYVAELPKLVTPENEAVSSFANSIKETFQGYEYESNFKEAALKAFDYVNNSISVVATPIQFWLMPEETLSLKCGDHFDRAVLLCSMLIALGNPSSKIAIITKENYRAILVCCELNDKILYMDIEGRKSGEYASKDDLLHGYGADTDDETAAYEFNDKMYVDLA